MVAHEKMQADAEIGQFTQLAQQAYMSFGYYPPIFIPEVEQVAHQKDLGRIVFDPVQESDQVAFTFQTGSGVGSTQMKIGKEVDPFLHV